MSFSHNFQLWKRNICILFASICFSCTEDNAQASNSGPENQASSRQAAKGPVDQEVGASALFQEPRVPYPYFSSLTEKEQRRYLFLLSTYLNAHSSQTDLSEQSDYSQYLVSMAFVFFAVLMQYC